MYFVAGITGKIGGATAAKLLEQGHQVRALVRDPRKAAEWIEKGVKVHNGDLTDAATLADAMRGVHAAFLMQPTPMAVSPDFPEGRALVASITEALRMAPPPRAVVLSSVGSEQPRGLGNITQTHLLEEALAAVTFPIAFVRAGAFIENQLGVMERANETGFLDSFLQPADRAVPMIATQDIGAEVARLLTSEWSGKRIVEIGSPISPDEIASAMAQVLGRPVQARPIPREAWPMVLEKMGVPDGRMWGEMYDGFNSGWIDFGVPGTEAVAGTTSPAEVFAHAKKG